MNKDSLSDERLVSLHQQKRVNAFFTLYSRYRNYGYAIIYRTLEQSKLINALRDERDAILYDAIMETISCFDKERGNFRQLLSVVITHQTINYIREFKKDPLSDYLSLDSTVTESSNLRFMDSLTFADKEASPRDIINVSDNAKKVEINYKGVHKRRINRMIRLKEAGYSYKEIAEVLNCTEKSVRAIFYRIKKRIDIKDNNKIKK